MALHSALVRASSPDLSWRQPFQSDAIVCHAVPARPITDQRGLEALAWSFYILNLGVVQKDEHLNTSVMGMAQSLITGP